MGNLSSNIPPVVITKGTSYQEIGDDNGESSPLPHTPNQPGIKNKNLFALIDPRSPTIGVSRTPVEVVAEREKNRLERALKLQNLDPSMANLKLNDVDGKDVLTPNAFIDPRSPTFEYKRTPIAIQDENGPGENSSVLDDTSGQNGKVYDSELSVPIVGGHGCRDLRKRLFVAQMSEAISVADDTDKENGQDQGIEKF